MSRLKEATSFRLQIDIRLRSATADDLPLLEWYGQYTHFRRMFRVTYEDQVAGKRLMLLADLNGYPIGQVFILFGQPAKTFGAQFKKMTRANQELRGYLYALRVMDHFRGMGIGTRLLAEAEHLLLEHDNAWATISVAKINERALKLYERLGYRIYGEDAGRWSYVNHLGEIIQVHEPCWMLEKFLKMV
jgi:ribosomal protein S18 acetylase RimI-like enzyme